MPGTLSTAIHGRIEHTGIVDENINGAELVDGGIDHAGRIFDLADVGAYHDRVAAIFPDGLDDSRGRALVLQVIHDELGAFGRESFGNSPAKAPTAARDQSDLSRTSSRPAHSLPPANNL